MKSSKRFLGLVCRVAMACVVVVALGMAVACSSTDCPLNNTVMQKCGFYNTDGTALTLSDTLTVTVRDSVILNRLTNGTSIRLPMSYNAEADTLVFHYKPVGVVQSVADTVVVTKTNTPHFVSLDCARSMFHNITNVTWSHRVPDVTYKYAIQQVVVKNAEVNYEERENLQIFFTVNQ